MVEPEAVSPTSKKRPAATSPAARAFQVSCRRLRRTGTYGAFTSIVLGLVPAPPALMATFTASSMGSLKAPFALWLAGNRRFDTLRAVVAC